MRWTTQPCPRIGDERIRTGFLWLPMAIGNEWRWLERARWVEEWSTWTGAGKTGPVKRDGWVLVKWLEAKASPERLAHDKN